MGSASSRPARPVTSTNLRVHSRPAPQPANQLQPYQSVFEKIRAGGAGGEYDVVTNYDTDLPPVKSNLASDLPLRPKPPSEEIIRVSPAPPDYISQHRDQVQFGVSNPNWYGNNALQASTPGYGPDDFVVETVNLGS